MRVRLLGPLQLSEVEIPLTHGKARALFTYLLLFVERTHAREKLADILWPAASAEMGRRGLSNALYKLRQSLGECVEVDEGVVRLLVPGDWQVDVWAFDRLTRSADTAALRDAVELYSDDLAPEIYDDWIITPRLERREAYLTTLETLTERLIDQQQLPEALNYARRLVWAEPLRERNQQTYLRLLGRLGRRAEALAHYNDLCQLLQTELGIAPLPETSAIAADLRRETDAPLTDGELLPFTGRATERAVLIQQLEHALGGQGGVLALEGQPGLGKSRLLREFAASARWRGVTVVAASNSDRPAESPLAPLQLALAAAIAGPRRAHLELTLPAETLAAGAPLFPAWHARAVLPELPPVHQRYRFQQALSAMLHEITCLTPVLLILDDMQWADPLLWEYLAALMRLAPLHRLLVVLAWRRTELEATAQWSSVQAWEREGMLSVLTLQPLTLAELTSALPATYRADAQRLWAISGGNPFLLTEALHALEEGRAPETDVVARAQTLPAAARTALECAAVAGRTIPLALWTAVTELTSQTLTSVGNMLVERYFLHSAEHGYAFAHDLVQAAVYQSIPAEQKRRWHQRTAEALVALAPDHARARAFHLDRAGQHETAAALYRQVSEQEVGLGAYAEARAALKRALELWPETPSPVRAEMLLEAARLHFITDESEAQTIVEEAIRVAGALDDEALQARAALLAGELALKTGRHAAAHIFLRQALMHSQAAGDVVCQAEVHHQLGELALREGQMLEARAQHEKELNLARQIGNQTLEAAALEGLGFALANGGGSPEDALPYLRQSLDLRRALGDRFREAQSLLNLLSTIQAAGHLDEVLALGQEALKVNESSGYARGAAIVRGTLAQSASVLGQFAEARALITATLEYFTQVNDPEAIGLYTDTLGLIEERSGDLERAETLLHDAIAMLEDHQAEFYAALAQMDLGSLYVRLGRHAEAEPLLTKACAVFAANQTPMEYQRSRALLGVAANQNEVRRAIAEECWNTFQSSPPAGEERQYYLWALWQLLGCAGRSSQAGIVLQEAYSTLLQQAQRLSDPALRRSFFERVPINREIVAAHDEWQQVMRPAPVRLVRLNTPLGRPLTQTDYVEIHWTVNAPEDKAIVDLAERRRFILHRLLAEAAAQGVAPTDDDLAQALGVSRRTILRDMRALEQAGVKRSTRKRKQ